jgi:6-phosphogluconolactonase
MTVKIYTDAAVLAQATAELFARLAAEAVHVRGRFAVALSGGNTPRRAYELLAGPPFREQIAWGRVHVFFGDERYVPPNDPRSNALMARQALLDRVPIPTDQVHPVGCDASLEESAGTYEALLRGFFADDPRFDLMLLGMGADGHTASLFPGTPALAERDRWAVGVCPPTQELCRITLTAPVINSAAVVAFQVSGADKAPALRDVLKGSRDPERLPSQLIHPTNGELIWLVDESAASLLPRK